MQICKLCMSSIQDNEFTELNDYILKSLEFLQIDLDVHDEESNFLCGQCDENIEYIFDFKSCVVINTESNATNKGCQIATESTKCHLCKNYQDQHCVISLTKLLKDDIMMEVFQGHLQEVVPKNVENLMVCVFCQKSLYIFSNLIESWLKTRNLNRMTKNGNHKKSQLVSGGNSRDIDNSKKVDVNEIMEGSGNVYLPSGCVKKVEREEIEQLQLKSEEVEIKDEDEEVEIKDEVEEVEIKDEDEEVEIKDEDEEVEIKDEVEEVEMKDEDEEVEIKDEDEEVGIKDDDVLLEDHVNHRTVLEVKNHSKMFQCYHCLYQTDKKSALKEHMKVHESLKDLEEYSDKEGSFLTKFKTTLDSPSFGHLFVDHKNLDQVQEHKCEEICYETRRKRNFKMHLEKQKIFKDQLYKCNECSYDTTRKGNLEMHVLIHKSLDKVQLYKCKECSYETRHKGCLKRHLLQHKSLDEVQLYKCKECSYETRHKENLKMHLIKHKSLDEVRMYKCKDCCYESRHKESLKNHILKHKSLDEIQIYKCKECSFETKRKHCLKRHLLIHKSLEEIEKFKCKECSFETRHKRSLQKHMLKHKSFDEIQMYKCKECSFESKRKDHLKRHLIKHKSLDEVQMYKCKECSFETRYKRSIQNHMVKHKS